MALVTPCLSAVGLNAEKQKKKKKQNKKYQEKEALN